MVQQTSKTLKGNYFIIGYWSELPHSSIFEFTWEVDSSTESEEYIIVKVLIPCTTITCCILCIFSYFKRKKQRVSDYSQYQNISRSNPINYTVLDNCFPVKYCLNALSNPCPICFEEYLIIRFKIGDEIRETSCSHTFHAICLDEWVESKPSHYSCPICKKDLFNLSLGS